MRWVFPLAFVGWLFTTTPVLAVEESCVTCHQNLSAYLGHNFKDWKKSVHAAKGVGCNACHNGNAKTDDPVEAHQGVLSSRDKKSSVYFQNVAGTCGRCHSDELKEFKKSAHYRMLQASGKGPNCLTCHGAMATTILTYADLESTCSLCHGKPTRAAQAFNLLRSASDLLSKKKDPPQELKERFKTLQKKWHSFDVDAVIALAQNLIRDLKGNKP